MPGTIHVSVLGFAGLESSSPLPQLYIKVSMGKREYQTSDRGDFTFPLTSLRDNLVVTLHDSAGNELSRTGIETRLVVQKGTWDDVFSFQEGGHVCMRLHFVLSEEDRQRIRVVRESALRKKHEELVMSSMRNPNDTGRHGDASSSSSASLSITTNKISLRQSRSDAILSDPALRTTESIIAAKDQSKQGEVNSPKKRISLEKVPVKVSNLVNAFESSGNQDMKAKVKSPLPNMAVVDSHLESAKNSAESSSRRSAGELTGESASASGRPPNFEHSASRRSSFFSRRKRQSDSEFFGKRNGKGIPWRRSVEVIEDHERYCSECSGAWIFPEKGRQICVTAGGKRIINLTGFLQAETGNRNRKIGSFIIESEKNLQVSVLGGSSKERNSSNSESSRGPVSQVMRLAIMVGFGTLVLFARDKKNPGR